MLDSVDLPVPAVEPYEDLESFSVDSELNVLLDDIRLNRDNIVSCLEQRLKKTEVEELPRRVLLQVLNCLKTRFLNRDQQFSILESSGGLLVEAWDLAKFENNDLVDSIGGACEAFDSKKLSVFFEKNNLSLKTEVQRQHVFKSVFYGNWDHLCSWGDELSLYRELFPNLTDLLKLSVKPDGRERIDFCLENYEFLKEFKLNGVGLVAFCKFGNLSKKLSYLSQNKIFLKNFYLTGSSLGSICEPEGGAEKIQELLNHKKLLKSLELSGDSLGKLCRSGELSVKISVLNEKKSLLNSVNLKGPGLGRLCRSGNLKEKLGVLSQNNALLEQLELNGSSLGLVCGVGDLFDKLLLLSENENLLISLGLKGDSLGKLCKYGDLAVKLKGLSENKELLLRLNLKGSGLGGMCMYGNLSDKLADLLQNEVLLGEFELMGASLGCITTSGNLSDKLLLLSENKDVLRRLGLKGASLGLLCKCGNFDIKLDSLIGNEDLFKRLNLKGSSLGEFCVKDNLSLREKLLSQYVTLLEFLDLKGASLGHIAVSGNLPEKLRNLSDKKNLLDKFDLKGARLGRFCKFGNLSKKLNILVSHEVLFESFCLGGFKLSSIFVGETSKIDSQILKLMVAKSSLDRNKTFISDSSDILMFTSIFKQALSGFIVSQNWTVDTPEFQSFSEFLSSLDFHELFIQASTPNTKELKTYINSLTMDSKIQYLLLTYLTGNKAVGQKQWAMLSKVIKEGGRGFLPRMIGSDRPEIPDDYSMDFSDSFDFEYTVIESLHVPRVLQAFFTDSHFPLTDLELNIMTDVTGGFCREICDSFLDRLLSVFQEFDYLKSFLMGDMDVEELANFSENLVVVT